MRPAAASSLAAFRSLMPSRHWPTSISGCPSRHYEDNYLQFIYDQVIAADESRCCAQLAHGYPLLPHDLLAPPIGQPPQLARALVKTESKQTIQQLRKLSPTSPRPMRPH